MLKLWRPILAGKLGMLCMWLGFYDWGGQLIAYERDLTNAAAWKAWNDR